MSVAHILASKSDEIISLQTDATLQDVSNLLAERRIGAILILNSENDIAGIISERDIVRAISKHKEGTPELKAEAFMTRELITCGPQDSTDKVMQIMTEGRVRHLPVMAAGKLAGFISIGDVVKQRIAEVEMEAEEIKRYISS